MSKLRVFMIMPFSDELYKVYEMIKREFENDYEILHAGEIGNQQNILEDIFLPLFEYDVIIADLTGLNPNVLYELGVAHSFNKKVIIITQDKIETLPFDLKQYRAKDYDTSFPKFSALIKHIKINLEGVTDGSIKYSNPVNDFLLKSHLLPIDCRPNNVSKNLSSEITEMGYFDYLSEIEDNTNLVTGYLEHIAEEFSIFSEGLRVSTEKINQAKQSKTATVSFVKFQAKIVAGHMDRLSSELRNSNSSITAKWNFIEKNSFDLFESDFSHRPESKDGITTFVRSLFGLKSLLATSSEKTEGFRLSLKGVMGLEGSLNQQVKFLTSDLTDFISTHSQIAASIDRIIQKSKYEIGGIDFSEQE